MGSVVVSLDAELGWGFHDRVHPPERRIERARWGWRRLVDLFDEFDVPATWAVVGHLLLDDCDGDHRYHPAGEEWFARERGIWCDRPELLVAPDLIRRVVEAAADHELGCHTFSHVEFGATDTSQALARAELTESLSAAIDMDISFRSFVFPHRSVGNRDVLAEWGFECYRGSGSGAQSAAARLLRAAGVGEPTLVRPTVDEYGLVDVPASLYLFEVGSPRGFVEPILGDPIVREVQRGIDAVAASDDVFHVWLHPNNITEERDIERMRAILRYLDRHRDAVDVETMCEVARRTRAERTAAVRTI